MEGDPSATRAATSFMTVAFVDATDPTKPTITDRVRIEGGLVSARLVEGEVRLVTTSNMADLGFVVPTTPRSVPIALEQNRRTVATSTAADWIPDWQHDGGDPTPLKPGDELYLTQPAVDLIQLVGKYMFSGAGKPADGGDADAGADAATQE